MVKLFNNFGMAIVAILMIVGFSAFKVAEKFSTPENGWYDVTVDPNFPNDESKQSISASIGSTPPEEDTFGCSQTLNTGNRCSIYLEFHGASSVPLTVEDARLDIMNISVGNDAKLPE